MEKLEWFGYPMVKKFDNICLDTSTLYRRVTDRRNMIIFRQAYGQTASDSIVRAVHSVARGVKMQRVMDGPSTDIFSLYVK